MKKRIYLSEVFPPEAISKAIKICLAEKYLQRPTEMKAEMLNYENVLENGKMGYYLGWQIEQANRTAN